MKRLNQVTTPAAQRAILLKQKTLIKHFNGALVFQVAYLLDPMRYVIIRLA